MMKSSNQRAAIIRDLMAQSPMYRNQVAAISGLSNPYLRDLEHGRIANVGREKLIGFSVALNLALPQTDQLLTAFGQKSLETGDIPAYLGITKKIQLSAAMHPVQDTLTYDLVILAAERQPGNHVIASPRPASCLRDEGHRRYNEAELIASHPLYGDLMAAILKERRRLLMLHLTQFTTVQYICIECLRGYMGQCEDPEEKHWRAKHLKTTAALMMTHENFKVRFTSNCPGFVFVLKSPPREQPELRHQLFLTALPPHRYHVRSQGRLAGFATDNSAMVDTIQRELKNIKNTVVDQYSDQDAAIGFLEKLTRD